MTAVVLAAVAGFATVFVARALMDLTAELKNLAAWRRARRSVKGLSLTEARLLHIIDARTGHEAETRIKAMIEEDKRRGRAPEG